MEKLSTAVLAGGKSRRMGGINKSFLSYRGEFFIERILSSLSAFDEVLISVGDISAKEQYSAFPYEIVEDLVKDIGPMGAIYSCLACCKNEYLFVCATDMPHLKKELIEFMLEFVSPGYDCFVLRSANKIEPLCAIYKKSLLPLFKYLIDQKKYSLLAVFDNANVKYIPLKYSCFSENIMTNINTDEQLKNLKRQIVFCVSGVKDSGKTTLITKLIKIFKQEGYKVGTIKHHSGEFEIDQKNTDTYRFKQAGSDTTAIYSNNKLALIKSSHRTKVEDLFDHFENIDIIIVEGLKHSDYPKIELIKNEPICNPKYLMAIITEPESIYENHQIPVIDRNNAYAISEVIKKNLF